MRKTLITLALAALLCGVATCAAAEGARITTRGDFARAFEAHADALEPEFELSLSYAMLEDAKSGIDTWISDLHSNCGIQDFRYSFDDRRAVLRITDIEYRVAVRLAYAYRHGNVTLTAREQATLQKAASIVQAAPAGILERERYLHDTLCSLVTYYTDNEAYDEKDQAVGALLNGMADCDGYSEAFYLLCQMAGIPARFQHGDTYDKTDRADVTHMWNLVQINGAWLMVDVTWDDADSAGTNYYLYYNIGSLRAGDTHIWNGDVLTVSWAPEGGNAFRPAALAEQHAASEAQAEAIIRDAFIQRHADSVAFTYDAALAIGQDKDDPRLGSWVYPTGVLRFSWKTGGHSVAIIPTEWDTEYRIVSNDEEALSYVQYVNQAGLRTFSIYFAGDYGRQLFADNLAAFRRLEGEFGLENTEFHYSTEAQRITYSNASFITYFRVCRSDQEIRAWISELADRGVTNFALCVPGSYGEALFANKLSGLSAVLAGTRLASNPRLSYYTETQVVRVRDAQYWSALVTLPRYDMDRVLRQQLQARPDALAVVTDGTFSWNENALQQLGVSAHCQGVDTYSYIVDGSRVELHNIRYVSVPYGLVDTEEELLEYLRECRASGRTSFRLYCGQTLYEVMSANNFKRFLSVTSKILKNAKDLRYIGDYCMISMDNAKYVR